MKVLLIGSGYLGLAILDGLLHSRTLFAEQPEHKIEVEIVGVFPWSFSRKGKTLVDPGEKQMLARIKQNRLPLIRCASVNHYQFIEHLNRLQPDVLLVGCWGEILKSHLLNQPDLKVVNCHPSKLPAHRGANPYVSAILAGETESGVTFHWINEAIDDGPIILQRSVPILPDDTGNELRIRCCETAQAMVPDLVTLLPDLTRDACPPQPFENRSYHPQIQLKDGAIFWEQPPDIIMRRLRGLKPWLSSYSFLLHPRNANGNLLYIFHHMALVDRPQGPGCWSQTSPPGTIIRQENGALWIQSAEPDKTYQCEDYQLYLGFGFLPRSLSRWFTRYAVHPGRQFAPPQF